MYTKYVDWGSHFCLVSLLRLRVSLFIPFCSRGQDVCYLAKFTASNDHSVDDWVWGHIERPRPNARTVDRPGTHISRPGPGHQHREASGTHLPGNSLHRRGLAYVGAIFALSSVGFIASEVWEDLAVGAQVGLTALVTGLFWLGGWWIQGGEWGSSARDSPTSSEATTGSVCSCGSPGRAGSH